jgi:ribosomal protein S18 acetylase RimI-like enzyme
MIKAKYSDKKLIINILSSAFDTNQSVNYIIPQDKSRARRIRTLMEYSFDICYSFGEIYLSDDKKACALILLPEKKKITWKSILWDARLAFTCVSLPLVGRVLDRESKIKRFHPDKPFYYLWFLGVDSQEQHKGIGTKLLKEVIEVANAQNRPIYLETSTLKNIPWYEKFGFKVFNELYLTYKIHFLKRELSN